MTKLSKLLKPYESLFEELDFEGIELNFNHYMEIEKGNEDCIYSLYWLMSFSCTGHSHIVLIPILGKPIEEWTIAYYDDGDGTACTFSSSIKTWFPAYFLYRANQWYPIYLKEGRKYGWVADTLDSLEENKEKIIVHGQKFMPNFQEFYEDFFKMVKKKSKWNYADWLQKVEPNSFLVEYLRLNADKKTNAVAWKEYIFKYPFYNQALFDQLYTENVQFDGEDDSLDTDLCWEFWNRNFKLDMPYYKILPAVAKQIVKKAPREDSPFMPFIRKIYEATKDDKYGYYEGTEGFFEVGKKFEKEKNYAMAIRCFENSILHGRSETEEYFEDSYDHIAKCAKLIDDKNYLAYLKETK